MKETETKKPISPWYLLEFSTILDADAFQRYCAEHPEEVAAVKEHFLQQNQT